MPSRLPLAIIVCAALQTMIHAQNSTIKPSLPRVMGTEVASEIHWERRTDISVETHTAAFGNEPFYIDFSITHQGFRSISAPEHVDVLLVRERAADSDLPQPADGGPVLIVIDGLSVPLTMQTHEGADRIKGRIAFHDFQWIAGAKALEFEAFGRRFVFAPGQVTALKEGAVDWARPQQR
jgi:hypothetical protein